jgi:hypothetical protein
MSVAQHCHSESPSLGGDVRTGLRDGVVDRSRAGSWAMSTGAVKPGGIRVDEACMRLGGACVMRDVEGSKLGGGGMNPSNPGGRI